MTLGAKTGAHPANGFSRLSRCKANPLPRPVSWPALSGLGFLLQNSSGQLTEPTRLLPASGLHAHSPSAWNVHRLPFILHLWVGE